jgi:predicted RNA-binding Zn-ribbon protein involved in translation (DUF1610 family)
MAEIRHLRGARCRAVLDDDDPATLCQACAAAERRPMTSRYHCDSCGWDGETPTLAEDPLGGFLWTLRVCPDCGEEVYQVVILEGRDGPLGAA